MNKLKPTYLKILIALPIIIGLILIIYPEFGNIAWYFQHQTTNSVTPQAATTETNTVPKTDISEVKPFVANVNTLVIRKINVNAEILDSEDASTLDQGIWHRSSTGNPEAGGNMVVTGHRFQWLSGPKTFYHLDKLEIGDEVIIYWNTKKYTYKIVETKEVLPTQVEIEQDYGDNRLTLYTCTLDAQKRIVRIAKLADDQE